MASFFEEIIKRNSEDGDIFILCKFQEKYEKELQKHRDEAASKVDMILARAEEQGLMIESLHTSVSYL